MIDVETSRLDTEDEAGYGAKPEDFLYIERVCSAYGARYRVVWNDGRHGYILFSTKEQEAFWDQHAVNEYPEPIEVEPGVFHDPWCPSALTLEHDEIYDGHVSLGLLDRNELEYELRLPIEVVRRLAAATIGHDLE